jgi:succinoglycan biosynthesis transport protein ExoP
MKTDAMLASMEQVQEYGRLIMRYWQFVLMSALALTFIFTLLIARLPNIYEATTTILVDPQQIPEKYVSPAVTGDPTARLSIITQQVLSRTRLQDIITRFGLYSVEKKSLSPEELIARMRGDITIQVKQGSGAELSTFTITFQGKDRFVVAAVANELATSFIHWNVDSREQQVAGTKDFLTSELADAKQKLEEQEDKLRQFKMSHLGETPDQTVNNLQAVVGLRTTLQANIDSINRLEGERLLLVRLPEAITAPPKSDVSLSAYSRLLAEKSKLENTIQQLREQYSDRYPDVVRATARLADINQQLAALPSGTVQQQQADGTVSATAVRIELLDQQLKRMKTEQERIQSQIASYQAKIEATPLREQQLVQLSRNYDISKQHYQALLDKSFNVDMAADLEQKHKAERFSVIDPAQPAEKPVKPKRKFLIPLATFAAFALSIMFVVAKETLNPAVKNEEELKAIIPARIQVMALIPRIVIRRDRRRTLQITAMTSLTCLLLVLAILSVLWRIRPTL